VNAIAAAGIKDASGKAITANFASGTGNISNYNEIMEALYNKLSAAEAAAGAYWNESESERIEAIQEEIDAVQGAIDQYEETKELLKEIQD
jgi:hypothetical protein